MELPRGVNGHEKIVQPDPQASKGVKTSQRFHQALAASAFSCGNGLESISLYERTLMIRTSVSRGYPRGGKMQIAPVRLGAKTQSVLRRLGGIPLEL